MRFFKGLAGLCAGTGLCVTGAAVVVGCGEDFSGCKASRTCAPPGSTGGDSGASGATNTDAASGGSGGSSAGKGGSSSGATGGRGSRGGSSNAGGGEGGERASQGASGEAGLDARGGTSGRNGSGGASGDDPGGGAGEGGHGPTVDDVPPTIVGTTPSDGAKGVVADAEISVTFSEPMNPDVTVAAYVSDDLPAEQVTFEWTDDNTRLVVKHAEPLEYAEVTSASAAAKVYSITLRGSATDVAGNPLGQDWAFEFRTLRNITQSLHHEACHQLYHPHDGSDDHQIGCLGDPTVRAGDTDDDEGLAFTAGYDIGDVAEGVVSWDSATIYGPFNAPVQDPFREDRLEDFQVYVLNDGVRVASSTWTTPASYIGVAASWPATDSFTLDVLEAVQDQYENPGDGQLGLLFRFKNDTNVDGTEQYLETNLSEISLDVAYVAP